MVKLLKSATAAMILSLGFGTSVWAASLDLNTATPAVMGSGQIAFFDGVDFTGFGFGVTGEGDLGSAATLDFLTDGADFGTFDVLDSLFEPLLSGMVLTATGFTDQTIELQFSELTGSASGDFDLGALLTITFDDDLGSRTSIFDGLDADTTYEVDVNVAAVVPLPASVLMLAGALAGLFGFRRRQRAAMAV